VLVVARPGSVDDFSARSLEAFPLALNPLPCLGPSPREPCSPKSNPLNIALRTNRHFSKPFYSPRFLAIFFRERVPVDHQLSLRCFCVMGSLHCVESPRKAALRWRTFFLVARDFPDPRAVEPLRADIP